MSYVDIETIQKVLSDELTTYPTSITSEIEYAESEINSKLAGYYLLPFDDPLVHSEVPSFIEWIAAYLVGHKIWESKTILEGQTEDTAGTRWKGMADLMLDELRSGYRELTYPNGSIVIRSGSLSAPRFYPSGTRIKEPSEDNNPYFRRKQAHEW